VSVPLSLRAAAALTWILAVGLGVPCVMAIRNLSMGRGIPLVLGFPAYGGGAFERHGLSTTIPLLLGFLTVCIFEAVAGSLLWGGHTSGAILAIILLVPGALFWWGFDLPYPPMLAIVRTVLLVLGWSRLA
jgi:hypothetical protein